MASATASPHPPRWFYVPFRVLLVSFILTLFTFAVSLTLGILGTAIAAALRGLHPDMTQAYRHIAAPVAALAGALTLISMTVLEIRRYRQEKALTTIANSSK